jgi:hypothetical protein
MKAKVETSSIPPVDDTRCTLTRGGMLPDVRINPGPAKMLL